MSERPICAHCSQLPGPFKKGDYCPVCSRVLDPVLLDQLRADKPIPQTMSGVFGGNPAAVPCDVPVDAPAGKRK